MKNNFNDNDLLDNDLKVRAEKNNKASYQELLEKIKTKVEAEATKAVMEKNDFEETQIINREELNRALGRANAKEEEVIKFNNEFVANESGNFLENNETPDQRPKPVVEVLGIKKRIGIKTIVEDITFDMYPGEIIGLLGPNGSGKTTIMRMMVGLTKISKGDIYCFEKPLGIGKTKMLAEVGSMIESPEFYNYMTGYANLKQIARISGKSISKSRIKELLEFVGLTKVARKKVKTYSLGMRQRLGLAQALLHDPKVLILDEPVNGLDPQGVQEFRNKLRDIASTGVSIIISSHLLDEIEKVSDRIIVLEKGRIIADDTLENICGEEVEKTLITTYDDDRAEILVRDVDLAYERSEEGFVFENISKEDKARVISYLVGNYVEIDTIKVVRKTLEERFLEITGKGGR
ncbi:ABC transporter ATP-binding protein [Gemella sp. zg-570]|uniref:ABC transporter ATP-binding protein n=1 Tax=Gemella sp. zg-570 TaxID=2840371 RepID=UPI001C0AD20D|nr:ABC transporter ATP-binding protein [Gemella sp. zg-570]QWQ38864.1 ABC transporter ATP-binding protein [Gemella sp. zg-570]